MALTMPSTTTDVEALHGIFPDVEGEVLEALLAHFGDVEQVARNLLETEVDEDALTAQALQAEQDEEVARSLHASIQLELRAAEQAQSAHRRISAPRASTMKALLHLVRLSKVNGSATSTSSRLLDHTDAPDDSAYSPIVSTYVPPIATCVPSSSTYTVSHDADARYSSRVNRARTANKRRFGTQSPPTEAIIATPDQVGLVPAAELI